MQSCRYTEWKDNYLESDCFLPSFSRARIRIWGKLGPLGFTRNLWDFFAGDVHEPVPRFIFVELGSPEFSLSCGYLQATPVSIRHCILELSRDVDFYDISILRELWLQQNAWSLSQQVPPHLLTNKRRIHGHRGYRRMATDDIDDHVLP